MQKERRPKENAGARTHESAEMVTQTRERPPWMLDASLLPKRPPVAARSTVRKPARAS